jgi:ureidoglycolate dehydrogenase (NAD+)
MADRTLLPAELERWTRALLIGSGLREDAAETVAAALVEASRRGVDSHGVARVPIYAQRLRAGLVNGDPHPNVVRQDGAVALMDADHGPGQVAGVMATDLSVELAGSHGVGVVGVRRSTHYGSAGYYAMRAAEAGMIGVSTTNSEPFVVPYGGKGHALGTNPIALAAPTADGIFDLDMATSQVAVNRIINARDEGRPIPEDWGVDEEGRPTTDPEQVFAAVPLGGYKGYALAVLVEILSGVLTGAGVRHGVGRMYEEFERPQDVGSFHLALDPERFIGRDAFAAVLTGMLGDLKQIAPAAGFDEVLVPGEPEARASARRDRDGVPLPGVLWDSLVTLSGEVNVPVPGS